MDSAYDLVVVGGGIAGGALAIVMARAGYSVLLLEETDAFQDKVRGEWIAPWGVAEVQHPQHDRLRRQPGRGAGIERLALFLIASPF